MTWTPHPDEDRFLDVLAGIEFDRRYYARADLRPQPGAPISESKDDDAQLLRDAGFDCKYFARERFFRHEVVEGALSWWLHFSFSKATAANRWGAAVPSALELGIYLHTPRGSLGGTAHGLALQVARRRDGAFERTPAYPRL